MSLEIDAAARSVANPVRQVTAVAQGLHLPVCSRFHGGPQPRNRAAVFLDRDGVLVRDVHFLRKPSQIDFLAHVESLASLKDRYFVVIATNQSGIAREFLSEEDLLDIHSDVVLHLVGLGVIVDAFYYCPHLQTSALDAYQMDCDCRKPKPGMLLRAAREWALDLKSSYMIGDSLRDVEAGTAAGLSSSFLIGGREHIAGRHKSARDLAEAVHGILGGTA
jgi:histidinol-phosphate phosphatase family protein